MRSYRSTSHVYTIAERGSRLAIDPYLEHTGGSILDGQRLALDGLEVLGDALLALAVRGVPADHDRRREQTPSTVLPPQTIARRHHRDDTMIEGRIVPPQHPQVIVTADPVLLHQQVGAPANRIGEPGHGSDQYDGGGHE